MQTRVDKWLLEFVRNLKEDDLVMVTADHGCDPATPSTDHSREYIPLLLYGKNLHNSTQNNYFIHFMSTMYINI